MQPRQVAPDEAFGVHARRFDVLAVDARVADVRVRERDELPAVRRVGEDLLVPGDGGVEDDLAHGAGTRADGAAVKGRSVGEDQDGGVGCGHRFQGADAKSGKL